MFPCAGQEDRKPADFLLVNGQKYAVVGYVARLAPSAQLTRSARRVVTVVFACLSLSLSRTVLLLIRIFLEYCQCVNDIPSIATDMLTRLSDLLKVGNRLQHSHRVRVSEPRAPCGTIGPTGCQSSPGPSWEPIT